MRNHQEIYEEIYPNAIGNEEAQGLLEEESDDDAAESRRCHHRGQRHTHEYLGSVKIAEIQEDPHNHRFAGVTGQAINSRHGNHYHLLEGNTDFYEDHFHIVSDRTGPAIDVGDGRHVHFVCGHTTISDRHRHKFQFATLIENPIGD